MKNTLLKLIVGLCLAFGLVACKSGGAKDAPASQPAAAKADDHGHDHHGDGHGHEHGKNDGHHGHADDPDAANVPVAFDTAPAVGTKAKCPVSGEVFVIEADTDRAEHDGKHYAFCCSNCAGKFAKDPAKFANK